ncbi:AraC family transcriptional regulator [Paenibacillus sp. 598K]|uniref:AraC family transcriptional regulator n=1 Tax=Paenibacillus sp. 598K TaxID=1117987 RepID=UPI000FFF542C|nr:AraC family transcriptional regulator [Paenibacillus sp. 598K]
MLSYRWEEIEATAVFANRLVGAPGETFGPRTIREHQLVYVDRGQMTARVQDRRYRLGPGELVYYGPDIVHSLEIAGSEPCVLYGLHFSLTRGARPCPPEGLDIRDAAFADRELRANRLLLGQGADRLDMPERSAPGEWIRGVLHELQAHYYRGGERAVFYTRSLVMKLLVELAVQTAGGCHSSPERHGEASVAELIRERLEQRAERPYDVGWLTEWTAYHANYAARLFRRQLGLSPHDYHRRCKLVRAQELLRSSELSINEIAERLHFSGIHYFSKAFKQFAGRSPSDYRRLARWI